MTAGSLCRQAGQAEKVFSDRKIKGEITLVVGKDSKNVHFD